jgi:hypothetical protein
MTILTGYMVFIKIFYMTEIRSEERRVGKKGSEPLELREMW